MEPLRVPLAVVVRKVRLEGSTREREDESVNVNVEEPTALMEFVSMLHITFVIAYQAGVWGKSTPRNEFGMMSLGSYTSITFHRYH